MDFGLSLGTIKVSDARRRGVMTECRAQKIFWFFAMLHALCSMHSHAPQGGAIEGNTADDILMVDQGIYALNADIASMEICSGA